jgi:hypothetical protein
MQKKVLIGVGVGCGVLLLAVVGVVIGLGFWAKSKLADTTAGYERLSEQSNTLAALEKDFPFDAPGDGELLKLDAKRLEAYFAVREEALPVFQSFEEKSKAFEKKHGKSDSDAPNLGAAVEAMGLMGQLIADTRASYIDSLKKHQMSPSEFHAITRTLYATYVAGAMQGLQAATASQRTTLEKGVETLDTQLENEKLGEEERSALQTQRDALQAQLDASEQMVAEQTPPSKESQEALTANAALLEQHKDRIQKAANPAFDMFVMDGEVGGDD